VHVVDRCLHSGAHEHRVQARLALHLTQCDEHIGRLDVLQRTASAPCISDGETASAKSVGSR